MCVSLVSAEADHAGFTPFPDPDAVLLLFAFEEGV